MQWRKRPADLAGQRRNILSISAIYWRSIASLTPCFTGPIESFVLRESSKLGGWSLFFHYFLTHKLLRFSNGPVPATPCWWGLTAPFAQIHTVCCTNPYGFLRPIALKAATGLGWSGLSTKSIRFAQIYTVCSKHYGLWAQSHTVFRSKGYGLRAQDSTVFNAMFMYLLGNHSYQQSTLACLLSL